MDIDALKAELAGGHPVTGAYNADDALAAAELNVVNQTQNRPVMTGSEVMQAIDKGEFNALSASNRQQVWDVLHLGTINPFGVEADLFVNAFDAGSASITALQALRKLDVSRAVAIGLGIVKVGHIQEARL